MVANLRFDDEKGSIKRDAYGYIRIYQEAYPKGGTMIDELVKRGKYDSMDVIFARIALGKDRMEELIEQWNKANS